MVNRDQVLKLWQQTCQQKAGFIVIVIGTIDDPKTIMIEILGKDDDPTVTFNTIEVVGKNFHALAASALEPKNWIPYQMITENANSMLRNMINDMTAEIVQTALKEHPLVK